MTDNLNTYNSASVVNWYAGLKEMTAVELSVFELHSNFLKQAAVLDIGIGGGRTTRYLKDKCKTYTGIDYSQGFVTQVKKEFPRVNSLVMDARDLSAFTDQAFDFVNFSFNGIDYVNLDDRIKILSEIERVLKPNGLFFFSTHNKDHATFQVAPWLNKYTGSFTNLKTFIKLCPFLLRKFRNKKNEFISPDYAIINDSAHNYSLFTFYTSVAFLKKQLSETKFDKPKFYSKAGKEVSDTDLDDWIFVLTKKSVSKTFVKPIDE